MGRSFADVRAGTISPVDFRRPSRIGRDAVVLVESAHDAFSRRLGTAWSTAAHAAIELEHVATDQTSVDDYVRALPNPTVLAQVRVERIGATALVELDLPLALLLVERVLGGPGDARGAPAVRRPTELETALVRNELVRPIVHAVDEALQALGGPPSLLLGVETSPQVLQLASSSSELLMLLTYRVEVRGDLPAQGLLTVGYPVSPLLAHVDELLGGRHGSEGGIPDDVLEANRTSLLGTHLDVEVQLGGTTLHAGTLAALSPGDVLRLDHHVLQPARLVVSGREIGSGHLGRRGRKLAVQIAQPIASTS